MPAIIRRYREFEWHSIEHGGVNVVASGYQLGVSAKEMTIESPSF